MKTWRIEMKYTFPDPQQLRTLLLYLFKKHVNLLKRYVCFTVSISFDYLSWFILLEC